MGLGFKMLNPRNMRNMVTITKLSSSLMGHMKKRCAYCDMDMGQGDDYPVIDFVKHLADKHLDKIKAEDIEHYNKLIKKVTG